MKSLNFIQLAVHPERISFAGRSPGRWSRSRWCSGWRAGPGRRLRAEAETRTVAIPGGRYDFS